MRTRIILLCLICCVCGVIQAAPVKVALIYSDNHQQYQKVAEAIQQHWLRAGLPADFLTMNSAAKHAADQLNDVGMVVTVGMQASRQILQNQIKQPMLAVMVPRLSFNTLLQNYKLQFASLPQARLSAVFLDQPVSRLANLAGLVVTSGEKMGMLLSENAILDKGLDVNGEDNLTLAVPENKKSVVRTFNSKLRGTDVLLLAYDPAIIDVTTTKQILYLSYRRRLPVIAYSQAMVRAGAVAGVFSSAEQVARHAAEILTEAVRENPMQFEAQMEYPRYFSVACNESVARYLDLPAACDVQTGQLEALE